MNQNDFKEAWQRSEAIEKWLRDRSDDELSELCKRINERHERTEQITAHRIRGYNWLQDLTTWGRKSEMRENPSPEVLALVGPERAELDQLSDNDYEGEWEETEAKIKELNAVADKRREAEIRADEFSIFGYANIDHASRLDDWTPGQGIAYILGGDPKKLTLEAAGEHASALPMAKRFIEIHELAESSVRNKKLSNRPDPLSFIAWAKGKKQPVPKELEAAINEHNGYVEECRPVDDLIKTNDDLKAKLQRVNDDNKVLIGERDKFAEQLTELRQSASDGDVSENGVTVRLPHMTEQLEGLFSVMRKYWNDFDSNNPPKQVVIGRELDEVMGWKHPKDGGASRNAQNFATGIRPDHLRK